MLSRSYHELANRYAQVFFIETLHSFGIAIFVFHILPKLDAARSLLIMNAVCLVPAFLKLFLTKSDSSIIRRSLLFLMDFFAFAMQCSCMGIALASKFLKTDGPVAASTTTSAFFFPDSTTTIPYLNRHRRQDESFTAEITDSILLATPASNISSIDQNLQTILSSFYIQWELPVALILVSLSWYVIRAQSIRVLYVVPLLGGRISLIETSKSVVARSCT